MSYKESGKHMWHAWKDKKKRRRQLEVLKERYENIKPPKTAKWRACFYCGEPADTTDHYPPLSRISGYEAFNLAQEHYAAVPACQECNRLLSDSLQVSLWERFQHCKDLLQIRYRKVLRTADWEADELEELSPQMRREVAGWVRERKHIERRLAYETAMLWWLDNLEDLAANL